MPETREIGKVTTPARTVEGQVTRALGSIGAATLVSRVLGFARDMIVAQFFGAGLATDAFFVAFRIPNMLRRLLGEGALSTAVIPVLSDYAVNRPRAELVRMIRAVLGATLVVLSAVTLAGVLTAPWLLAVIAPGFSAEPPIEALAVLLTRVMFPYLPLVALAALAMGVLNAEGRFFAAALGSAVVNVGMIGGVLLLHGHVNPPIVSLAIGVLVGGVGQLVVQLPSLRAVGLLVGPSTELAHPALGRILRLLGPAVFGLAAVQITVFVNTLLASLLPSGSISYLYYADRVMEFPLGVFGIALASASLPAMSRQAASGDTRGVARTLGFSLRMSFYISVPATVGLIVLREPITRILFQRGRFGATETAATAAALLWYAAGLAGFSASRITAQAFYAIGEPGTAVKFGVASVAVNVAIAAGLMMPLGHPALALASSAAAYANLAALVWAARRRFGLLGGREIARSFARTCAASALLGAWCVLVARLFPPAAGLARGGAWLAVTIGIGAAIYWIASGILRASEREVLAGLLPWRSRG